jgi:hypothetical protein
VLIVSSIIKFTNIEEQGEDRIRAISDLLSNIGLDSYYLGLSTTISFLILKYQTNIPSEILIILIIYGLFIGVLASIYKYPYENLRRNWCFILGLLIGMTPISYVMIQILRM